jgi:hypothetical protein
MHYAAKMAQNYMAGARLGERRKRFRFSTLEPTVLYRIAALPDEIAAALAPDTPLCMGGDDNGSTTD